MRVRRPEYAFTCQTFLGPCDDLDPSRACPWASRWTGISCRLD